MQFKVPQFLEIEDRIFGPFTFRQFVYLTGGAGICFVLYKVLGLFIGAIPILLVATFAGLLAFYRPNNKPFLDMVEAGIRYALQSKLYIWKRREIKKQFGKAKGGEAIEKRGEMTLGNPRLTKSKLRDLAWSLDVLDLSKHTGENQ